MQSVLVDYHILWILTMEYFLCILVNMKTRKKVMNARINEVERNSMYMVKEINMYASCVKAASE